MTSTEIQTFKIIWENKGRASVFKIARELKVGNDYCRVICGSLVRKGVVKFSKGRYRITDLGKEVLEKMGVIKKSLDREKSSPS